MQELAAKDVYRIESHQRALHSLIDLHGKPVACHLQPCQRLAAIGKGHPLHCWWEMHGDPLSATADYKADRTSFVDLEQPCQDADHTQLMFSALPYETRCHQQLDPCSLLDCFPSTLHGSGCFVDAGLKIFKLEVGAHASSMACYLAANGPPFNICEPVWNAVMAQCWSAGT